MPTSVKAFFDQKVPAVLATSPEKAKDVAAIYLFKISGADGGTWTVDLVSTPPTCVEEREIFCGMPILPLSSRALPGPPSKATSKRDSPKPM